MLFSCKKEQPLIASEFGFLNLINQTSYQKLLIKYNNVLLNEGRELQLANIKVPAGQGRLSILDDSGKPILDTLYNTAPNATNNWILFQPTAEVTPVVLENNGSEEPQPDKEHIKVKFANFAPKAFAKPVDVIFYWSDPNTFELVEGGRINKIGSNFPAEFAEVLYKDGTYNIVLQIVDSETQQPVLDDIYAILSDPTDNKRILTLYFVENEFGSIITGTSHKIIVKTLFAN